LEYLWRLHEGADKRKEWINVHHGARKGIKKRYLDRRDRDRDRDQREEREDQKEEEREDQREAEREDQKEEERE